MEIWVLPMKDGTYDIVVRHELVGTASTIYRAYRMACRAQQVYHGVILFI
jgi:hypothetical protein